MRSFREPLILILLTAALAALLLKPRDGPSLPDEADYWQLAESLRAGQGMTTRMIRPLELCSHPSNLFTDISRPPAFPYLVAVQRFLTGDEWISWNPTGTISLILLSLALWMVGCTLGGRWVGRASWALVLFNPWILFYSSFLLSELPFCSLTALFILAMLRKNREATTVVIIGLLLVICFYTRSVAVLYLPAVGLSIRFERRRARQVGILIAAVLVPVLPWLVRMWRLTGNPFLGFNSLQLPMFTATWPGYALFRSVECVSVLDFVKAHPSELWAKWWGGFGLGIRGVASQNSLGTLTLAALSPILLRSPLQSTMWRMAGICVGVFLLSLPFYEPRTRHYLPLVIWITPLAACGISALWSSGLRRARFVAVFFVAAICWHHVSERSALPCIEPLRWDDRAEAALRALPQGTVIATDAPWIVALATSHRSLWLPQTLVDWDSCRTAIPAMTAAYVTPELRRWSEDQRPVLWKNLLDSGGATEYLETPLMFPDGSRLWRVTRSHPRISDGTTSECDVSRGDWRESLAWAAKTMNEISRLILAA